MEGENIAFFGYCQRNAVFAQYQPSDCAQGSQGEPAFTKKIKKIE